MKYFPILVFLLSAGSTLAATTNSNPIPEDSDTQPEVIFTGHGIGTLKAIKSGVHPSWGSTIDYGDSSLQLGVSENLFRKADGPPLVGSFVLGGLTSTEGQGSVKLGKAYVDLQCPRTEWVLGRAPRPSSRISAFSLLRDDDLGEFLRIENPYSSDPRGNDSIYGDLAQVTLNQDLKFFESIYVEHATANGSISAPGINGFGFSLDYRSPPGGEELDRVQFITLMYQHQFSMRDATSGLHQISAGWAVHLNSSVTHQWKFAISSGILFGSERRSLITQEDLGRLNSQLSTLAVQFVHQPFGGRSQSLALTLGSREFDHLGQAEAWGVGFTGTMELGHQLHAVAQYQGTLRNAVLASVLSDGIAYEQSIEAGIRFDFDAIFNEHLSPRRSILNREFGNVSQ